MGFTEDTAYLGPAYRALSAVGSSAAKGELLLSGIVRAGGGLVGTPSEDQSQPLADSLERDARERIKALRPDPTTTGIAVQMLHTLGEGATTMLAGAAVGGAPAAFGALSSTEGYSSYKDLIEQGVNAETAAKVATVRGIFAGAGAVTPMVFGAGLATRLMTGAASNATFGIVDRAVDSTILRSNGYGEMADQEQVFDRAQVLIDLALGVGFGGFHHLVTPEAQPLMDKLADAMSKDSQMRDAALVANGALRDRRSGPGVPVTPADMNAHIAAVEKAVNDLQDGEHVNVAGTGVEESSVLARGGDPNPDVTAMMRQAIEESGLLEETAKRDQLEAALNRRLSGEAEPGERAGIERAAALEPAQRDIETRFANDLGSDYEGAKARYAALEESNGGKVINTDTARELSPDYLADRTQSAAVHEPASWFTKKLYAEKLAEAPKPGEDNSVLFTAGGTGAGKSTAVRTALSSAAERAQIVYDTNMNSFGSALKKVNQALAAGKKVRIAYVYREPIEALRNGALPRAARMEAKHGSGRTVPIEEHIGTHVGSRDVIERLSKHFEGDDRVEIFNVDNSRGPKGAKLVPLSEIPKFGPEDYNRLRGQALAALDEEHAGGRISDAVYRGFRGPEQPEAPRGSGLGSELRGQPEQGRARTGRDELGTSAGSPTADIARAAVSDNPDLKVTTPEGAEVSARAALSTAAEETKRTEAEAPSMFKAAVDCFLRRGG
jgi:hypothetical protein